jgi:RNA polymerase-interacting CarD/CdnL/TRCF family regulator
MKLNEGDIVSGNKVFIGKYQGQKQISEKNFNVVYDTVSKVTHYIPEDENELRKLPSKKDLFSCFEKLKSRKQKNIKHSSDGRHAEFKTRLAETDFEEELTVLYDLSMLDNKKKLAPIEKKLFSNLKHKLSIEISYILDLGQDKIKEMLDFKNSITSKVTV